MRAQIIAEHTFGNFDMQYHAFTDLFDEGMSQWVAQGGQPSDLIEPVDGSLISFLFLHFCF